MEQIRKIIFKLRIINCILVLVLIGNIMILGGVMIETHISLIVKKQVMMGTGELMATGKIIKSYVLSDFQDQFDEYFNILVKRYLGEIEHSRHALDDIFLISFLSSGALITVFIMQLLLLKDITRVKKKLSLQEKEKCVAKEKLD